MLFIVGEAAAAEVVDELLDTSDLGDIWKLESACGTTSPRFSKKDFCCSWRALTSNPLDPLLDIGGDVIVAEALNVEGILLWCKFWVAEINFALACAAAAAAIIGNGITSPLLLDGVDDGKEEWGIVDKDAAVAALNAAAAAIDCCRFAAAARYADPEKTPAEVGGWGAMDGDS